MISGDISAGRTMRNFCPIVFHSLTDVLPVHLRFRSVAVRRRYLLLCLIAQLAILSLIWLLHNLISGHLLPVLSTIYSSITRKVKHSSRFSNRKLQTKSSQATVFLLSHLPYSTIYKGDNRIKTPIQKHLGKILEFHIKTFSISTHIENIWQNQRFLHNHL